MQTLSNKIYEAYKAQGGELSKFQFFDGAPGQALCTIIGYDVIYHPSLKNMPKIGRAKAKQLLDAEIKAGEQRLSERQNG